MPWWGKSINETIWLVEVDINFEARKFLVLYDLSYANKDRSPILS